MAPEILNRDEHQDLWFRIPGPVATPDQSGLRRTGGGGHQSKTMMLKDLCTILAVAEARGLNEALEAVRNENILGKSSAAAAASSMKNLSSLYSLKSPTFITRAMVRLWAEGTHSQPLLAVLCALARDPLLRGTAATVLNAPLGSRVSANDLAAALAEAHPNRFSPAMLLSLAQNCASTWTQSGHLSGRVTKTRVQVEATPEAATFAALIAQSAGFGGQALLLSPWMSVLDASPEERLSLLRRAQGRGLARVRLAGAVFELQISPELTADFA